MRAKVQIQEEIEFSKIIIGDTNLQDILNKIHGETLCCLQNISYQRQDVKPDYTDVDAPLFFVLNFIEKLRGY